MAGYRIEIVSYDPGWPAAYERELARLESALGDAVIQFQHMGSTAVPGLDSKPIIDISAAIEDMSMVPKLFPLLEPLGYKPIEQRSTDRYDLWRLGEKGYPSHILHFMKEGSDAWAKPLRFRDALRADSMLCARYGDLKRALAAACGDDIEKYGRGKTDFVNSVISEVMD